MIENVIEKLFKDSGLGKTDQPITPVPGGFMHRMYKVHAGDKYYAVKHLNPGVMARESAAENFDKADALETIIEEAGIPIVPSLVLNGQKRQCIDGNFFYVFNWQEGRITDWNNITCNQCYKVGNILGRIHSLNCAETEIKIAEESAIDWEEYVHKAEKENNAISDILSENISLLKYAEGQLNAARKSLPAICCISNEDMDPKNVMWNNNEPIVIDLECLDYGNPVSHVLQLSLQWAGITTCNINQSLVKAFFEGYFAAYDNGFRAYETVFGLAYTWVEWLEYNICRALGAGADETECVMGVTEVKSTIKRMQYLFQKEKEIKDVFEQLKDGRHKSERNEAGRLNNCLECPG